jgi:hypothetical protein
MRRAATSRRPSVVRLCTAAMSRWLRAGWFTRLPHPGTVTAWLLRLWRRGRPTAPHGVRPALEGFEDRALPNDLLGTTSLPLLGSGLFALSPAFAPLWAAPEDFVLSSPSPRREPTAGSPDSTAPLSVLATGGQGVVQVRSVGEGLRPSEVGPPSQPSGAWDVGPVDGNTWGQALVSADALFHTPQAQDLFAAARAPTRPRRRRQARGGRASRGPASARRSAPGPRVALLPAVPRQALPRPCKPQRLPPGRAWDNRRNNWPKRWGHSRPNRRPRRPALRRPGRRASPPRPQCRR